MKKNYLFRTAMCLGIATMMSFCLTSGTYAKYVKTIAGTGDSARVAKFAFDIKDGTTTNNQSSASITIDLFNTVKDAKDTTDEGDVKQGASETVIAPGTWGFIPVTIDNKGEVTIDPVFNLQVTNLSAVNIKFAVETVEPTQVSDVSNWESDITALNDTLSGTSDVAIGGSVTKYLCWTWPYSDSVDTSDTTIGITGSATVTVTVGCTVTQVD